MIRDLEIEKELSEIIPGWIILIEVLAEDSLNAEISVMKTLTTRGYSGVVLASSRPSSTMAAIYQKSGIVTSSISFVDCVSKAQAPDMKDSASVIYLDTVSDLTDISISIHSRLQALSGERFVMLDSLPTMLIHNKPDAFVRFMHAMFTKLRLTGAVGIMISTPLSQEHDVRAEIVQLCDQVIKRGA